MDKDNIKLIREMTPEKIAAEIVSVQPMPEVDFDAIERSCLWQSFCARHFPRKGQDKDS